MEMKEESLKLCVQELLGEVIVQFELKGRGCCNDAYFVEVVNGSRYIVKQERKEKTFAAQNSLIVEAAVAKQLYILGLKVPRPVFMSEEFMMYGYEFVEGFLLSEVWPKLSDFEKISICTDLGRFHAEIGEKFKKEMAVDCGIEINMSKDQHPEILEDYARLILDKEIPKEFVLLVKKAKAIFDKTKNEAFFHFIHNDAHHENIIIKDNSISGIIDFGEAEYGEAAKEFSRYIRDFPNHFQYIVEAYEAYSGNKLSYKRLVSNSFVSGFVDYVEDYKKGGESRRKAEEAVLRYEALLT